MDLKFSRRCTAGGCAKRALWARPGAAAATRCRAHREAAFVHVPRKLRLVAPCRAPVGPPAGPYCWRRGGPAESPPTPWPWRPPHPRCAAARMRLRGGGGGGGGGGGNKRPG